MSMCVRVCVIEVTLVKLQTGKSSRQMDSEKNRNMNCVFMALLN